MLENFLPWIRNIARDLYQAHSRRLRVSENLLRSFLMDNLQFVRSRDSHWLTRDYIGLSHDDRRLGWIYGDIAGVYHKCDSEVQRGLIERGPEANPSSKVNAVLFPDALALLKDFNPKHWALRLENILSLSALNFHAPNLLWAQIALLDVTIHYLIHTRWHEPHEDPYTLWNNQTVAVIQAVTNSWKDSESKSANPMAWNLAASLTKQSDLFPQGSHFQRDENITQLEVLLKLRSLFVLAFLMLNPDSSDIYLAEGTEVVMPMV
ncbi:hypothetical protein BDV29DRAFT_163927 [Aspergillus leporis]|uniref:Uncharacterized protein n=1 Tax=Aspergillus leporis TaxID=41062 RepID=A0A5N5WFP8_9EURO|nr:hypothetical protein BDV29DRAFT_163927 [Aspergillus leporis]